MGAHFADHDSYLVLSHFKGHTMAGYGEKNLEANGYGTELVFDGNTGEKIARAGDFDAILLDVMLPGKTGFDICRDLWRDMKVPIIMEVS